MLGICTSSLRFQNDYRNKNGQVGRTVCCKTEAAMILAHTFLFYIPSQNTKNTGQLHQCQRKKNKYKNGTTMKIMPHQNLFLLIISGFQLTGCVSSVAVSSSLYTLMVLSASAVSNRLSDWSKAQANIPDSLSKDPGCTAA